jgi:AraC family transcriptional regulator of adaptative response / DNA-3-methyladenine glycosylase II
MKLDPNHCYTALKSRDARFDGRFFAAVTTTGVYCRPVCPARKPLRRHIRFYPCAAAAEEDGFRPCLRCRPETAPGSPAWEGTSATVTRALRLISEGCLDEDDVNALALKLGVGDRQLRRLFQQYLGVAPLAVAQTRRLHFAKQLLDETNLSITDIVFASGFSSIRRFNSAFKDTFGQSPSSFRNGTDLTTNRGEVASLQVKISYRPPFDWTSLIRFLRARAIPGVEDVDETRYRRTACEDGVSGIIEVQPEPNKQHLILKIPQVLCRGLVRIVAGVRRIFDLDADPYAINEYLKKDPLLADSIKETPGIRVPGAWDGFEIGVRAILGQQVSVKGATTLSGRLVQAFGSPIETSEDPRLCFLFPTPEQLSNQDIKRIGLPKQRARAIRELAKAVGNGTLNLTTGSDPERTIEALTALSGIGPWTAQYIAMRVLREPDAFLSSDLVLRRAAANTEGKVPTETELLKIAEPWRPWRAYAAMYLWTQYSRKGNP